MLKIYLYVLTPSNYSGLTNWWRNGAEPRNRSELE
jgi:hypothetical protein